MSPPPLPGPGTPNSSMPAPPTPDPSMDEILASIRRILDEESPPAGTDQAAAAVSHPGDVLELDATMMVPEPHETTPGPIPPPPSTPPPAGPPPLVQAEVLPLAVPVPPPPRTPAPDLVAPAAAAASASIGALIRTLASERTMATHRGGPTIEDLVREEMRPLLKEWLDTHLAPLVERLVRAEIERVVGRGV